MLNSVKLTRQVLDPYSSTAFMLLLKTLSLSLVEVLVDLHSVLGY